MDTPFFDIRPGTKATPLNGGRNSQVVLVHPQVGSPFVIKRYYKSPADNRDRQGTEAMALRFFDKTGIESVPRLLNMDKDRQVSKLSFIKGAKVIHPTAQDINLAAQFLLNLNGLCNTKKIIQDSFPPASEAFFSVIDILKNIEMRLTRLEGVSETCPLYLELRAFLHHELYPAYAQYATDCRKSIQSQGISLKESIPHAWRILSPSDFGMHNALKDQGGGLSFLDFEYFGWDDPAKTLADFCLHPAMNLNETLKHRFLSCVLPTLTARGYNLQRAVNLFPIFGIKWCCILLNEFVPRDLARRSFSGNTPNGQYEQVLARQLAKARIFLNSITPWADTFSSQIDDIK